MGGSSSTPLQGNIEYLHNQLMSHTGANYDIATLNYEQFLSDITKLNRICSDYKDQDGRVLVFAVKKGTDTSLFWRATVRIACVNFNTKNNKIESHRLLNIRQFLQAFRRITYECTNGAFGISSSSPSSSADASREPIPPTMAATSVLGESLSTASAQSVSAELKEHVESSTAHCTNLEECIICLENKPDVILPCAHAYCVPCIEQWWEYCDYTINDECSLARIHVELNVKDKSCPVCRECIKSSDDSWVLSEAPDDLEVCKEIQKSLISIATEQGGRSASGGPHSQRQNL